MLRSEQRKLIGERITKRRKELDLSQQYVADKMGVNKSTIQRYEKGTIDNSKKLILEGLSEILSVPTDWLLGNTDAYESEIKDDLDLLIRDEMETLLKSFPLELPKEASDFSKETILVLLKEYNSFNQSFLYACQNYASGTDNSTIAKMIEFDSTEEYNELMFLREIMHSVSTFREVADIIQNYAKEPKRSQTQMHNLRDYVG